MKISLRSPSFSFETWYFSLEDAPEIKFRDGEMFSPTEVTVSQTNVANGPSEFYLTFTSPLSKTMAIYSSADDAKFRIDSLPAAFTGLIFKETL